MKTELERKEVSFQEFTSKASCEVAASVVRSTVIDRHDAEIGYQAFNKSRGSVLVTPFNRQPRSVRMHWQAAADAIAAEVKKDLVLCEFPECASAKAVKVAGDSYQRGYAAGVEKAAEISDEITAKERKGDIYVMEDIAAAIRATAPVVEGCEWDKLPITLGGGYNSCLGVVAALPAGTACPYCSKPLKVKEG